jgi:hypothetical protein
VRRTIRVPFILLTSISAVMIRNPSDFVGTVLGESEEKTKGILNNAVGKVLVIDEAYMLYGGGGGDSKNQSNQYKTSVIDTIVAEVQNVPGEDRCVLLLGYEKQMDEMFQVGSFHCLLTIGTDTARRTSIQVWPGDSKSRRPSSSRTSPTTSCAKSWT